MARIMARMLCALLALALLFSHFPSLAEEGAGGELFRVRISDVSVETSMETALGTTTETMNFLPVLALAYGADAANERFVLEALLTLEQMKALDVKLAQEDGLLKLAVWNARDCYVLPLEQMETTVTSAAEAFGERLSDPAYAAALGEKLRAAVMEKYPDWYKGEAEMEQDGVTATVARYEFALESTSELAAFCDFFFFEIDEDLAAVARELLAKMDAHPEEAGGGFAEVFGPKTREHSLHGTFFQDEAGKVLGADLALEERKADGSEERLTTFTLRATQIGAGNKRAALLLHGVGSSGSEWALDLNMLASDDGEARESAFKAAYALSDVSGEYGIALEGASREAGDGFSFDCALKALIDGGESDLTACLDGAWQEDATYLGTLRLTLSGDMLPKTYSATAGVFATREALPAGALLTDAREAIDLSDMDVSTLMGLFGQIELVSMTMLSVLTHDPTIARLYAQALQSERLVMRTPPVKIASVPRPTATSVPVTIAPIAVMPEVGGKDTE